MSKNLKSGDVMEKVAVGVGVAAAVAAAAGAVFLYGTKAGAKKRKQVKSWALKLKGEVLEQLEEAQECTEETYHKIVDEAKKKYEGLKNVDASELAAAASELKGHWRNIKRQITGGGKKKKAGGRKR